MSDTTRGFAAGRDHAVHPRPLPAALVRARHAAAESWGPREKTRLVSDATLASMTAAEKTKLRWGTDPDLVEELVRQERAWSAQLLAELEDRP